MPRITAKFWMNLERKSRKVKPATAASGSRVRTSGADMSTCCQQKSPIRVAIERDMNRLRTFGPNSLPSARPVSATSVGATNESRAISTIRSSRRMPSPVRASGPLAIATYIGLAMVRAQMPPTASQPDRKPVQPGLSGGFSGEAVMSGASPGHHGLIRRSASPRRSVPLRSGSRPRARPWPPAPPAWPWPCPRSRR